MPGLPTGTVTLLFCDVEGSTRLVDRLGERYGDALADWRRLMREAFDAHAGREVDTQGDAFLVAFERAPDAAAAAAAAQQTLAAQAWPEGAELRVRVGLHTGEPTLAEPGYYFGLDVHRGARICAAAQGGQVLLSRATRELLGDDAEVRDLGEHRLKDIPSPEWLFQLVVPGLSSEFPPPRTLSVSNLPAPATALIGRAEESRAIAALLTREGGRLVTLTGAGGSGKTRLAVEVAAELLDEFPNGVFFVPLASLADPRQLVPAVARVLGVKERPGESPLDTLAGELESRRVLLVLDNCERLLGAATDVAELLARCPDVSVLATSRERFNVLAEREFPLRPLPPGDGVALFVERARATEPEFEPTQARLADAAEIVRRLDGLPLAIELAASLVRVLPTRTIVERLGQRLSFLADGPRDLPERQRTLRATIDWSHDLLDDAQRRLFAQVAVFANGFSLEAAQAVSGRGDDVVATLAHLRDKHLLAPQQSADERPRFLMLDTIREYALERLAAGHDEQAVRARHADYFVELAERAEPELSGPDQASWLRALGEDDENLRAALSWARETGANETLLRLAGAAWRFWLVRGHLGSAGQWLDAALAAEASPEQRANALDGATAVAYLHGDSARAKRHAEENLALRRRLGEPRGEIRALSALANVVGDEDSAEAVRLYEEAAALARESRDDAALAGTITNLGYMALEAGDWKRAEELSAEAAELFRGLGHATGAADALTNRGFAAVRRGRWANAVESLADGLRTYAELGHRDGIACALVGLAAVAAARADGVRAAELGGAADALLEAAGAVLEPYERDVRQRTAELLGAELEERELAEWRAAGASLGVDDAIALGLEAAAALASLSQPTRR